MKGSRPRRRLAVRGATAVALLFLLTAAGCGESRTRADASSIEPLRWAPPNLVNPKRIELGDGYTNTTLGQNTDARIILPKHDKIGGVTIEGGHNIILIGGEITVPAGGPPGVENDRYRTGIYIKGATGTVHIEGVRLRGAPEAVWDGIDIASPEATVQLQNIRVDGVTGAFHGFHGDVVQPWGGVRDLRISRLTGSSNYQGLMLPVDLGPIGRAEISRVNLRGLDREVDEGGHLIWLTSGNEGCSAYPVRMRSVYIRPRADHRFGRSVWPEDDKPRACAAKLAGGEASWPALPQIRGAVRRGSPRHGDFVPRGLAGVGYSSPGYADWR
jgi:hypothetical protein